MYSLDRQGFYMGQLACEISKASRFRHLDGFIYEKKFIQPNQ